MIISLRLPSPPSLNSMYANRRGKGRGRILTQEARDYKQRVVIEFRRQVSEAARAGMPWTGTVHVEFRIYRDSKRTFDTGNFTKAIYDALSTRLWADDSQIVRETLVKAGFSKPGYCEIDVWPATLSPVMAPQTVSQ